MDVTIGRKIRIFLKTLWHYRSMSRFFVATARILRSAAACKAAVTAFADTQLPGLVPGVVRLVETTQPRSG